MSLIQIWRSDRSHDQCGRNGEVSTRRRKSECWWSDGALTTTPSRRTIAEPQIIGSSAAWLTNNVQASRGEAGRRPPAALHPDSDHELRDNCETVINRAVQRSAVHKETAAKNDSDIPSPHFP
jgi:hypothetical protein